MASPHPHFSLSLSPMLSILITLNFVYAAVLVSPSSQNLLTYGFTSTLRNVDFNKNLTKIELLQLASKRGRERMKRLEAKMGHVESSTPDVTFASHVYGEYIMNLSIGTPRPSTFSAFIDTGSDLTWTLCKPYNKSSTPLFDPRRSCSYSRLNCSSDMCNALPRFLRSKDCKCSKRADCTYKYEYMDDSFTRGVLATETFTFERNVKVPKLGFGCAFEKGGDIGPIQGLVALGRGNLSLVSQMKVPKFSYCLPTYGSDKTGLLSMGSVATIPRGAKITPLIYNPFQTISYYLSLQGITIGHTKLPIDKKTFEMKPTKYGPGGFMIDSGTTFTCLQKSAFAEVRKSLTHQLQLPSFDGSTTDLDFELCYNITRPLNKIKFPNFIFHFQGADFEVIPDNNFVFNNNVTIVCLLMRSSDGFSIFGNIQQQNALVGYDLSQNKLFFKPNTKCDT